MPRSLLRTAPRPWAGWPYGSSFPNVLLRRAGMGCLFLSAQLVSVAAAQAEAPSRPYIVVEGTHQPNPGAMPGSDPTPGSMGKDPASVPLGSEAAGFPAADPVSSPGGAAFNPYAARARILSSQASQPTDEQRASDAPDPTLALAVTALGIAVIAGLLRRLGT